MGLGGAGCSGGMILEGFGEAGPILPVLLLSLGQRGKCLQWFGCILFEKGDVYLHPHLMIFV